MAEQLTLDLGLKTFEILDIDGNVAGTIRFNPADPGFVGRWKQAEEKIQSYQKKITDLAASGTPEIDQWPVLKLLPVHLAIMLIRMLAYMEQITVSPSQISECMSMLTGVPIRLQKGEKSVVEADPHLVPKLGECLLGDTMVLGNRFADGTYQMLLEIGPLPAQKMETLFSDTIDRQILCDLMDLFLPADKEIQVRYIIQQEDAQFKLGNPTEQGAYLGISTYL